jgi:hypothetical protein
MTGGFVSILMHTFQCGIAIDWRGAKRIEIERDIEYDFEHGEPDR